MARKLAGVNTFENYDKSISVKLDVYNGLRTRLKTAEQLNVDPDPEESENK